MYYIIKLVITAFLVAAISELAKRYTLWAALLASLPLTSILAFIWLYIDTHDNNKIIELSYSIFWLVFPSLAFFIVLPLLLKNGFCFAWAMLISMVVTASLYGLTIWAQKII